MKTSYKILRVSFAFSIFITLSSAGLLLLQNYGLSGQTKNSSQAAGALLALSGPTFVPFNYEEDVISKEVLVTPGSGYLSSPTYTPTTNGDNLDRISPTYNSQDNFGQPQIIWSDGEYYSNLNYPFYFETQVVDHQGKIPPSYIIPSITPQPPDQNKNSPPVIAKPRSAKPAEAPSNSSTVIISNENRRIKIDGPLGGGLISSPESCADATAKSNITAYREGVKASEKKYALMMQATVYDAQATNATNSIATIDDLLLLLKGTQAILQATGTLDGIDLQAIPGGADTTAIIENAVNIRKACVDSQQTAIGDKQNVNDQIFVSQTKKHVDKFKVIRQNLPDLNKKIKEATDAGGSPKTKDLLNAALSLIDGIKADFIPIEASLIADRSDLKIQINEPNLKIKDGVLGVNMSLNRDHGELIPYTLPTGLPTIISVVTALKPGVTHIPTNTKYFIGNLSIHAGDQDINLEMGGSKDIAIPSEYIFKEIMKVITNKISLLEKTKEGYKKKLDTITTNLKKIEDLISK